MGCVVIYGGEVSLIHNTIAQFYSIDRDKFARAALSFANYSDTHTYPLNLEVKNCIITGFAIDHVKKEKNDSIAFNYHFYNSLLRTEVKDTASAKYYENIIWENVKDVKDTTSIGGKNFVLVDTHLLRFDFHLDSLSKANGAADARWMLPLNREGVARDEKKVNMGCY